jgi:hypothetical protein
MFSVNQILRQILKQQALWVPYLKEGDVPFSVSVLSRNHFTKRFNNMSKPPFRGRSAASSGSRWARMLFEHVNFILGQGCAPLGERGGHLINRKIQSIRLGFTLQQLSEMISDTTVIFCFQKNLLLNLLFFSKGHQYPFPHAGYIFLGVGLREPKSDRKMRIPAEKINRIRKEEIRSP